MKTKQSYILILLLLSLLACNKAPEMNPDQKEMIDLFASGKWVITKYEIIKSSPYSKMPMLDSISKYYGSKTYEFKPIGNSKYDMNIYIQGYSNSYGKISFTGNASLYLWMPSTAYFPSNNIPKYAPPMLKNYQWAIAEFSESKLLLIYYETEGSLYYSYQLTFEKK